MTILLLVKAACFSLEKTSIDLIGVHTAVFTQQSTVTLPPEKQNLMIHINLRDVAKLYFLNN